MALRGPRSNRRSQAALTIAWRTLLCSLDIWEEAELGRGIEKNRHLREGGSVSEQVGPRRREEALLLSVRRHRGKRRSVNSDSFQRDGQLNLRAALLRAISHSLLSQTPSQGCRRVIHLKTIMLSL